MGRIRRIGPLLAVLWGLAGCSPNPATPPGPPAEIPSSLRIPASLAIDVDRLKLETSGSALKAQVSAGGEFSEAISLGFTFTSDPLFPFSSNTLLEIFVLNAFSALDIPVSPTTFTLETTAPPASDEKPSPFVETDRIKIDFADFDFDGDGIKEGCSGCTCPTGCAPDLSTCPSEAPADQFKPVCLRVWVTGLRNADGTKNPDFQRYLAFVFDRLPPPDESNIGTGRLKASAFANPIGESFFLGAGFDHADPLNRSSEVSLFSPTFAGDAGNFFDIHTLQTQEGQESSARKTIFATFGQTLASAGTSQAVLQYVGRFLQDQDFWGGSVKRVDISPDNGVDETINFTDECAELPSGEGAEASSCESRDIDVTDETFLRRATQDDGALPADFPATPTF